MSESLFKNVAGFKPVNLSRQRFRHRRIFVNFEKCLRTPLFIEHPRWVLPKFLVVIGRFQPIAQQAEKELRRFSLLYLFSISK